MKTILCIVMMLSSILAHRNTNNYINEINSKQNLWVAGRNFPENITLSQIKSLLGVKNLPRHIYETIPVKKHNIDKSIAVPDSFDARSQWSKCESIKNVYDQSACGADWAVSVASAINDRICIHSDAREQPAISAKNIMGCSLYSTGCNGGLTYYAWRLWHTSGIVTGGTYKSDQGCQSYPFPPCKHDGTDSSNKPECPTTKYPNPECNFQCDNSTLNYTHYLYFGAQPYRIEADENKIQDEILKNGPVVATFNVHADFIHYKSGVYASTTPVYYGKHAVRIIGWGVESSTKYWLAVNSWNEDWGENGLFKILRGTDESKIESEITAGLPI